MVTIKEDYVSFEIAKLLKEKGFKGFTMFSYSTKGATMCGHWENEIDWLPKCTLQMAMKWLREACGLIISIEFQAICPTWKWRIYIKASNKKHTDFQHYNKYEEACEAAIKYCLENLI